MSNDNLKKQLAENMLRFGPKNLSQTNRNKLKRLAEQQDPEEKENILATQAFEIEKTAEKAENFLRQHLNASEVQELAKYIKSLPNGLEDFSDKAEEIADTDINEAEMSDQEFKVRSIIHKLIEKGTIASIAGVVPAMMSGYPFLALGLGIMSLSGGALKDAAWWKRKGYDKYQSGHHYGAQSRNEKNR